MRLLQKANTAFEKSSAVPLNENQLKRSRVVHSYAFSKRKAWITIIASLLVGNSYAQTIQNSENVYQIKAEGKNLQESLYTVNDGNTPDRFVSYLDVDGSQGPVRLPLRDMEKLNTSSDFTFAFWIKPKSSQTWGSEMTNTLPLFEFEDSLQCFLSPIQGGSILCESPQTPQKLILTNSVFKDQINTWQQITISGRSPTFEETILRNKTVVRKLMKEGTSMMIIQNQQFVIAEVSGKPYIGLQQVKRPFEVCMFGCSSEGRGFIGGIRDIVLLNQAITRSQVIDLKNKLLIWDNSILGYFRLSEVNSYPRNDQYRNASTVVTNEKGASIEQDLIPNDVCSSLTQLDSFFEFGPNNFVSPIQIDSRWTPKQNGWQFSASITMFVSAMTCTQPNPDLLDNCNLLHIADAFTLFQPRSNELALILNNAPSVALRLRSQSIFLPYNTWVTMQLSMDQYSGYQLQISDIFGRLISQTSEFRELGSMTIRQKMVKMFSGFKGLVKTVALYQNKQNLPIQVKEGVDEMCLIQMGFESRNIKRTNDNRLMIQQKCRSLQYGEIKVYMNNTKWTNVSEVDPTYKGQVVGLYNSSEKMFDGIACNEGNQQSILNSKTSYLKTDFQLADQLNSATIEFWFNLNFTMQSSIAYLSQSINNRTSQDLMTIFYTPSQGLICAPFGIKNPIQVVYKDLPTNETTWIHLSCSYNLTSVRGTLYYLDSDMITVSEYIYENSTIGTVIGSNMKNDTITTMMGNNRFVDSGAIGMSLKQLKFWNEYISESDIKQYRQQQVDPTNNSNLQSYVRFSEGPLKEFNMAKLSPGSKVSGNVQSFDIGIQSQNNGVLVCPLSTFYDKDSGLCYKQPQISPQFAIYSSSQIINETQVPVWTFDAALWTENEQNNLNYQWDFTSDQLVSQYVIKSNLSNFPKLSIPKGLFRDENYYIIALRVTNSDETFSKTIQQKFVPISCQTFTQTPNLFTDLTSSQLGLNDITITVQLQTQTANCNQVTFFNTLQSEKVSVRISPNKVKVQPQLQVQPMGDNMLKITIPKDEQFKLDLGLSELKLVIDIKMTNKAYKANVNAEDLVFQNVIHSLKMPQATNSQLIVIQPVLKVQNQDGIVLKNETAMLDGSESYIVGRSGNQKYENLSYSWSCSGELTQYCLGKSGSYLNIPQKEFSNAGGKFQVPYQIILKVSFTSPNGIQQTYKASQKLVFYDIQRPFFYLKSPLPILVTKDIQEINITFNDTSLQPANYTYTWNLDPLPLNTSLFQISQIGNKLTLLKGTLDILTTYQLKVTVTHSSLSQASYTLMQTFTTTQPPYNGTITLDPPSGEPFVTTFTLSMQNWIAASQPLLYRVSQNSTSSGKVLTKGWVALNQTQNGSAKFAFQVSSNVEPITIEIKDGNEEIISQVFVIDPKQQPQEPSQEPEQVNNTSSGNNTNDTVEFDATTQQQIKKSLQLSLDSIPLDYSQDKIDQIVSINTKILSENTKNIYALLNPNLPVEKQYSTISFLLNFTKNATNDQKLMNLDILESSIQVLSATNGLIMDFDFNQTQVLQRMQVEILGNILSFIYQAPITDKRMYKNMDQTQIMKSKILENLCPEINSIGPNYLSTKNLDVYVKRAISSNQDYSIGATLDERVTVDEDLLIRELGPNVCYFILIYDSKNFLTDKYAPLSRSAFELGLINQPKSGQQVLQKAAHMTFGQLTQDIDAQKMLCMGLESIKEWDSSICSTKQIGAAPSSRTVQCNCQSNDDQIFGVFTQNMNSKYAILSAMEEATLKRKERNFRATQGIFIGGVALFALMLILMNFLDRRDALSIKKMKLTQTEEEIIKRLEDEEESNTQMQWKDYIHQIWQVMRNPQSSTFTTFFYRTHPITNLFGVYDPKISRVDRFGVIALQHVVYYFIIVLGQVRTLNDKKWHQSSINQEDMQQMWGLAFLAVLLLIPVTSPARWLQIPQSFYFKIVLNTLLLVVTGILSILSFTTQKYLIENNPFSFYISLGSILLGSSLGSFVLSPLIYSFWNSMSYHRENKLLKVFISNELREQEMRRNRIREAYMMSNAGINNEIVHQVSPIKGGESQVNHEDIDVEYDSNQ